MALVQQQQVVQVLIQEELVRLVVVVVVEMLRLILTHITVEQVVVFLHIFIMPQVEMVVMETLVVEVDLVTAVS